MDLKQALQRSDKLERKVKELEARPAQTHIHYHNALPAYTHPPYAPIQPLWPTTPNIPWYEVTCAVPQVPNGIVGNIGGGRQQ